MGNGRSIASEKKKKEISKGGGKKNGGGGKGREGLAGGAIVKGGELGRVRASKKGRDIGWERERRRRGKREAKKKKVVLEKEDLGGERV